MDTSRGSRGDEMYWDQPVQGKSSMTNSTTALSPILSGLEGMIPPTLAVENVECEPSKDVRGGKVKRMDPELFASPRISTLTGPALVRFPRT